MTKGVLSTPGDPVLEKKARKEGYEKDLEIDTDDVIRKQGAKACYVPTDVRNAAQVESLTRTASDYGRLDIIVNNAGVSTGSAGYFLSRKTMR